MLPNDHSTGDGRQLLAGLDSNQAAAVMHRAGPALVDAGAGAGKTGVITRRVALMINEGCPPDSVLAVTFTTMAAAEMKDRIGRLTETPPDVFTFHAWARKLLQEEGCLPEVLEESRSAGLLKKAVKTAVPKQLLRRLGGSEARAVSKIGNEIDRAKNRGVASPDLWQPPRGLKPEMAEATRRAWRYYESICRSDGLADFNDLLLLALKLLRENANGVLDRTHERYRHVIVDEFQDSNSVQFQLVRYVVEGRAFGGQTRLRWQTADGRPRSFMVVGDADQSIYAFRGSDVRLITGFAGQYRGGRPAVYSLGTNYRSQGRIVRAAAAVISNNGGRTAKAISPDKPDGDRIGLYAAESVEDEARFVADAVEALRQQGERGSIGVLSRRHYQGEDIRRFLAARGLPVEMSEGVPFARAPEAGQLAHILRAAARPTEENLWGAVSRKGQAGLEKARRLAKSTGISLWEACCNVPETRALAETVCTVSASLHAGRYVEAMSEAASRLTWVQRLARATERGDAQSEDYLIQLLAACRSAGDPELAKVGSVEAVADRLAGLLEAEAGRERGSVEIMTVHASKGLERDIIFIVGAEEGVFPDGGDDHEEERRLFYVAMTRAKKRLFISYDRRSPSRFLREIPEAEVALMQ